MLIHCHLGSKDYFNEGQRSWDCCSLVHSRDGQRPGDNYPQHREPCPGTQWIIYKAIGPPVMQAYSFCCHTMLSFYARASWDHGIPHRATYSSSISSFRRLRRGGIRQGSDIKVHCSLGPQIQVFWTCIRKVLDLQPSPLLLPAWSCLIRQTSMIGPFLPCLQGQGHGDAPGWWGSQASL